MRIPSSLPLLLAALMASACTSTDLAHPGGAMSAAPPSISPSAVGESRPGSGFLKGYLAADELPDSLALLAAPPAVGSADQEADNAAFHALRALQNSARGELAREDANLKFPPAEQVFACALGVPVSEQATPHLNMLLRRVLTDAAASTSKAKNNYNRTRPFVAFKESSCTPEEEDFLRKNGSYPSGHAAAGWAQALVLAELAPDRSNALLQRGRAYGQSRGICGAHWKSDIEAGRLVGAAAVARLHTNPTFMAQFNAARDEVKKARTHGAKPARDCTAEAASLATSSALAP